VGQPVFSIGRTLPGIESGIYPFTPRTTGFVNRDFGAVVQGNVYCYEDRCSIDRATPLERPSW